MRADVARGLTFFRAECRRFGIRVVTRRDGIGKAWQDERGRPVVEVPRVRGLVSLATALHELAHILLGHIPLDRCDLPIVEQELAAWGWTRAAFDQHSIPWTPAVGGHAIACMALRTQDKGGHLGRGRGVISAIRKLCRAGIVPDKPY